MQWQTFRSFAYYYSYYYFCVSFTFNALLKIISNKFHMYTHWRTSFNSYYQILDDQSYFSPEFPTKPKLVRHFPKISARAAVGGLSWESADALITLHLWHTNRITKKHMDEIVKDCTWIYENQHTLYSKIVQQLHIQWPYGY